MFRKKLAVLVAAALMTLSSSSAFAAFADLELIRVVYNQGTVTSPGNTEIATDLGTVASVKAGGTFGNGISAFTAQTGGTAFSNLYVAYFAINSVTKELWVTSNASAKLSPGKGTTVTTIGTSTSSYYNGLTKTGSTVAADASFGNSYRSLMDVVQNFGAFGTIYDTSVGGDKINASLAALATGGSVTQSVFYINGYNGTGSGRTATPPVQVASFDITTHADGSTTVGSTTPTPIPAAFYLMGSGLLGLVGLRRRNRA